MRYDPRFCSKKRLAHLALREKPPEPEPEPTRSERIVQACQNRHQAIPRSWRKRRAQSLLDTRRARGERLAHHPFLYDLLVFGPPDGGIDARAAHLPAPHRARLASK